MSKLQINNCIMILAGITLLFGCNSNKKEMNLDFSSSVGKYKSTYEQGEEFLELKDDPHCP